MADMRTKVAGVKTRNGKPLWKSENDYEPYSEKTATFEYGDGYIVTPTIDPETGGPYKIDDLLEIYEEEGPYDLYTGEKLPVFEDIDTADSYAKWRSDNILNFDITDEEFFTGESGTYSKQDGSEITFADRKQDMIDYAAGARDSVYGFLGLTTDEDPDPDKPEYSLGGIATATRGITTKEGREMAQKKFQLDDKKADLDGNNEVSAYERARGEAIQKNLQDAPSEEVMSGDKREAVQMYHGGMPCGCGAGSEEECSCGAMDGLMGYDEVSGNPIPLGSSPENVRDDIDAKISTDEFVLPAHVVKWHGIKHIMTMYDEAEMGLMAMKMDGLIQHAEEAPVEEEVIDEPEEDVDVEVAAVEVDDKMDETGDTEKLLPKTSALPGMVKKQKIAFLY